MKIHKTMGTTWKLWTYDVWGNKQDGYEVNDRYSHGVVDLNLKLKVYNAGKPGEFISASITDYQLKRVFGVSCKLDVTGDDLHYYVERLSDGYPLGELACISHNSLSPVR